ncbi:MAG: hypothetical protein R6U38_04465 [Desulfatiglandaceae bacterium]
MCQSLVDKVARSRQLTAIAEPELLVLFEDWLEELEEEVISLTKEGNLIPDPSELASRLRMSQAGATFLLTKLRRQRRL